MPQRMLLTKNAQFFLPKALTTDDHIAAILDAASENRVANADYLINVIRETRTIPGTDVSYTYSTRVFKSERPVYFFSEQLSDTVYAFIALVEIDGYVAMLQKSCANISEAVEQNFQKLDSDTLTSTFDDDAVDFQKISLRNMTISDRALRARSYEAANLKGLLSTHAAGRSIPYFLKIRQGHNLKTISAQTARVVESSVRKGIDEIAAWIKEQVRLIQNPANNKGFMESFAKLVELDEVLAVTGPSAVLIEVGTLCEELEKSQTPMYYTTRNRKEINLSGFRQARVFERLEEVYEVDNDKRIVGHETSSRLRINAKSISISSKPLKRLSVEENGSRLTLQKYIVKNGLFSVCFNDPKYMYFMGKCFEDSSGISEIHSILDILIPQTSFATITSEKGRIRPASANFERSSMFSHVEAIHRGDDFIFCDDLGNEWADHITLNKADSCISFIHSKHNSETKSASKLHDLVGQGIKNLGNMYFTKDAMLEKCSSKFSQDYIGDNSDSKINRTRKGNSAQLERFLIDLLKDYRLHRKCILSCSFISKQAVTAEFSKIAANQPVRGHIIQLLWIISSFAHAARDMNIVPIIYCKP